MTELPNFNSDEMDVEVIAHPDATTDRSIARRIAIQLLYELDCANHPVGEVIAARLQADDSVNRKIEKYVRILVQGVTAHRKGLDAFIQPYAPDFPLDQVAIIDRNILRLAVFELASQVGTPVNVIIAEAIELASLFGAEGSTRFVNGVLGAIAAKGDKELHTLFPSDNGDDHAPEA